MIITTSRASTCRTSMTRGIDALLLPESVRKADCFSWRRTSRHPIPSRLHPPQQPIPYHRLHGTPQVLGKAEQLARLHRAEAFGMLLEQRDNTPAHVAAWRTRCCWGA